ncbi:p-aminobenzoyl-glutamate transporter AbgT [Rhizobium mongolense]
MSAAGAAPKTVMQRFLDGVEKVGNMVPHPVIIFLILIAIVIGLSAFLGTFGASITFERINPESHEIEAATTSIRSLLNTDGIRFMYESLIPNFMSFTAVGLMIAAMVGAGVAEESGLVTALIRKLVIVSPRWALTISLLSWASSPALRRTLAISSLFLSRASHISLSGATLLQVSPWALAPSPGHSL